MAARRVLAATRAVVLSGDGQVTLREGDTIPDAIRPLDLACLERAGHVGEAVVGEPSDEPSTQLAAAATWPTEARA